MTAEPAKVAHQWPMPPQDGYTVDDLFTLPELPPHTELIDGSLVFVSPQRRFHAKMINLLLNGLERTVPAEMTIEREITVVLDRRNGPEPDISVARSSGIVDMDQTHFLAADILLAIEVISPESEARDRSAKPAKYAAAGIPNFWLVERAGVDKHPVVHVYELDRLTKAYALTGIHHDRLKTSVPFTIDIDISRGALGR
ncbi:Uma2 family endonuclease [Streptomyces sp. NPDC088261]|uniref:Uma2 family endonuclease n=1 Tax=Streptomyces sp. NPDC088261 TaxID=3365851 RepID=UPI00382A195A